MSEWEKIGASITPTVRFTANRYIITIPKSLQASYKLASGDVLEVEIKRVKRNLILGLKEMPLDPKR